MLELEDRSIIDVPKLNVDFERNMFSKEDIANIISLFKVNNVPLSVKFNNEKLIMSVAISDPIKEIECNYEHIIENIGNLETKLFNSFILFSIFHECRHIQQLSWILNDNNNLSEYDYLLLSSLSGIVNNEDAYGKSISNFRI